MSEFQDLCFRRRAEGHRLYQERGLSFGFDRLRGEALEELADLWNYAQFAKERAAVLGMPAVYAWWHNDVQLAAERLALTLLDPAIGEMLRGADER